MGLALRLPVHVLHVHFEVVVPGELLVAQLTLGHRTVRVVSEFVPTQHLLEAKGQVAHVTLEGLLSSVSPHVLVQASLLTEGFVAFCAFVWLLPGVRPNVHLQSVVLAKRLVAVRALVRPLSCVAADVNSERPVAGELLSTVRADLLLLSCVSLLMTLQHRRRDKGLLAQIAFVFLVSVVHHLNMDVQRVFSLERGVALVTLERPLTIVDEEVTLQRKRGSEQGFALLALKRPFLRVRLLVVLVDVTMGELLPAQFTFVGFVFTVDDLVSRDLVQAFERALAHFTCVRALLRVCDHVAFELIGGDELLVAVVALEYLVYLSMLLKVQRR